MIYSKNSAKAIIINNDKILLLKKRYEDNQISYTLPGGTQEPGETLEQTVVREVYEEVAARVSVSRLINVYEHSRVSRKDPAIIKHKIEFAFLCQLEEVYQPQMGVHPDPHQVAVEWIHNDLLPELTLSPERLSEILSIDSFTESNIYLGKVF